MSIEILLRRVEVELSRHRYSFRNEKELHDGIAQVLTNAAIDHAREFAVNSQNRLDFFITPGVALEVKVNGSAGDAVRQCARYAWQSSVNAVVLATTRDWKLPRRLVVAGKPVVIVPLQRALF